MCSAKFKWYDYDSHFGSTSEDNNCIRPSMGMQQATNAPVDSAICRNFPGLVTPFPADTAVTMLRVNRQLPPPTGKKLNIQRLAGGSWIGPKDFGATKYHVVTEDQENSWRLEPDLEKILSIHPSIFQDLHNLPTINNNNKVPNTLVWKNNMAAQYEWTFSLTSRTALFILRRNCREAAGRTLTLRSAYPGFPNRPGHGKTAVQSLSRMGIHGKCL